MQSELLNGETERLLNHPLIIEILDELESDAMETAIGAYIESKSNSKLSPELRYVSST